MQSPKAWIIAVALVCGVWPIPASAQEMDTSTEDATTTDDTPPLAGFDAEQMAAFFTLVSASADLDAELTPMIDEMFTPGEAEPDWRDNGIDILAELGQLEGGLGANLLRDDDEEVLSVTDLSGKAMPDLSGFFSLVLRAPPPEGVDERVFASFAPGMWLQADAKHNLRDNAVCYSGLTGLTLHSKRPLGNLTMDELIVPILFVSLMDRVAGREFCLVYERDGDAFRTRSFLPDGRALPAIDAESTLLRIMPTSALSAFVRDSVPTGLPF
jgi:hypothetical protein